MDLLVGWDGVLVWVLVLCLEVCFEVLLEFWLVL